MKIDVRTNDLKKPIHLRLPNAFIFNRMTAHLIYECFKEEENIRISEEDIYTLMKAIKESLQSCGHFNMVHVESADGAVVDIDI